MISIIMAFLSLIAFSQTDAVYKRKDWHSHWADLDKNCRNTRAEVLIERSLEKVTFKNSKNCSVISGKWDDYYFNEVHYKAKDVDIDHLVPLFEAHKTGGAQWSKEKKKVFANDIENLVITSKRTNRSKGANTLKSWLPVQIDYACKYYKQWMFIKNKYALIISDEERKSLDTSKCFTDTKN